MRMRRRSVSALRWGARRFEGCERAFVGIESVGATEGHRLVAAGVAEGSAEDDGDFELCKPLRDDLLAACRVFAWAGQVADHEGLGAVESAAEQELGEEAVEAVRARRGPTADVPPERGSPRVGNAMPFQQPPALRRRHL